MDVESRVVASRWWRVGPFLLSILLAPGAFAQVVFNVNSDADQLDENAGSGVFDGVCNTAANTCTLRAAVMEANRVGGAGATIVLPAGTYLFTRDQPGGEDEYQGDLDLLSPAGGNPVIALSGAGAATTIIDANLLDRVLTVHTGRSATISGITLRRGRRLGGGVSGGGGGVFNTGVLTVSLSVISVNTSLSSGGGISNVGGTLVLDRSTVSDNYSGFGGGIFIESGTIDVIQSTISGNIVFFDGGGIRNSGNLFMTNSTVSGNRSDQIGGGIQNFGTANVYNSTIAFNLGNADADALGQVAGVFNSDGSTFNLRNSVVAGNFLAGFLYYDDCSGLLGSYGRNKVGTVVADCVITQVGPGDTTPLASLDELGSLQDNGGPTATHALASGSSMIDGAEPIFGCTDKNGATMTTDQRGAPRVAGVRCDIGAFEFGASLNGVVFASGFEQGEP